MKDSEFLIQVDFDNLIFLERNWKIKSSIQGRLGMYVPLKEVLNFYVKNKNLKDFDLLNYYIPDIMDIQSLRKKDLVSLSNFNFLEKQNLLDALIKHKLRGRKIQIITLFVSDFIKQSILGKFDTKTKDFLEQIQWISYWDDYKNYEIQTNDFPRFIKYLYIQKKILRKGEENYILTPKYKIIYYYSTDLAVIHQLSQFLMENQHFFEYKNNSIISYFLYHQID